MPPQNPVDGAIVGVSVLRVKLALSRCFTCCTSLLATAPIEPEGAARARAREPRLARASSSTGPGREREENRASTDRCGDPNAHPSNRHRETRLGERLAFTVSVLMLGLRGREKPQCRGTCRVGESRRRTPGVRFSGIHTNDLVFHRLLCRAHSHVFASCTCSSCSSTSADASCTSTSPMVRPRSGQANSWSAPSPTTRRRSTSSGTETRSMARTSFVECVRWESSRSSPRRGPHGRIRTASA